MKLNALLFFVVWKCVRRSEQSDDITYDPNLVQQLFLKSLERGIASPYVRSETKSYLKSGSVNDEALILAKKAAAAERDREENFLYKSTGSNSKSNSAKSFHLSYYSQCG